MTKAMPENAAIFCNCKLVATGYIDAVGNYSRRAAPRGVRHLEAD
jgi:hypothetical protein